MLRNERTIAAILSGGVVVALAQGTYTQIDYPGADSTYCNGINSPGYVVGDYYLDDLGSWHGFVYHEGVFTQLVTAKREETMRAQFSRIHLPIASALLAFAAMFLLTVCATPSAQAQTFRVLHTFTGGADGGSPSRGVIMVNGNLYGTTSNGGTANHGTMFRVNSSGEEIVIHNFKTGSSFSPLIADSADNFYSTAADGGIRNSGAVFKIDSNGAQKVLHAFSSDDRVKPLGGLFLDAAGDLYGTTNLMGPDGGGGTVFKLDSNSDYRESVLHTFKGVPDGAGSIGRVTVDSAGNVYGTTVFGGFGDFGTVFKVDPSGSETILHSFESRSAPNDLIMDDSGNLYGTTLYGGAGIGTAFEVDASGAYTLLYVFRGFRNGDGAVPIGTLVRDRAGNLYGTTAQGGNADNCGSVFKLSAKGNETVLHIFDCSTDGASPFGVSMDESGNLFGVTASGGTSGFGTVFEVTR